ncbi:MAG: type II secretion system F family protein [Acidimicrobiales bacterium]
MDPGLVLPAALVGVGLGLTVMGGLLRVSHRDESLSDILGLPYGEQDVPVTAITERSSAMFEGTAGIVEVANRAVSAFDARGSMSKLLERARLPIRAGEYVIFTICGGLAAAAVLLALTSQWIFAPAGFLLAGFVAYALPRRRIAKRRKAFEEQLPDAISLIAGSLQAGHTFLRAIQMMCEESEAPLSEEFGRVVQETRLGDSLVDALDRMAKRLEIKDLEWIVQAIRIQQSVGGKLADLLYTLGDYIRSTDEIRREVKTLTAEGRASAWMLGALPVLVLLAVQVVNPVYMEPMYRGWGIVWLVGTGGSVMLGVGIILRMINIKI